jgi:hypothetical protein
MFDIISTFIFLENKKRKNINRLGLKISFTGAFQFKVHPSAVTFVASNGPSGFVGGERTLTRN